MRVKNASTQMMLRKVSSSVLEDVQTLLETMVQDYGSSKMSELAALVAYLRALATVHQTHHWQTRGGDYYGDHLMFERLYGAASDEIDGVAEKAVGTGQHLLMQPVIQTEHLSMVLKSLYQGAPVDPDPCSYVALSLRAEMFFMVFLQLVYARLKGNGTLSLGVDNMLQGIADKHEESLYLLQQRSGQRRASALAWKAE